MATGSSEPSLPSPAVKFRVLSLDGGGAKGVYTLGFLSRLERDIGRPLSERFDLIYGTSTGSIISTLLSLGLSVQEVYELYLEHIPQVLSPWTPGARSRKLMETVSRLIGGKTFVDLKKPTGIVATNWVTKTPLVFKNYDTMAHSGVTAFIPGFGASLVEAVCASCSAVPIFRPFQITLKNRGDQVVPAYDGGFCANNPALFAIVDAKLLGFKLGETALFSVGVGHYPAPQALTFHRCFMWCATKFRSVKLLGEVLEVSSNTTGILEKLLLKEVRTIRADAHFSSPDLGTDLLETDVAKLRQLFAEGTQTYQELEPKVHPLL